MVCCDTVGFSSHPGGLIVCGPGRQALRANQSKLVEQANSHVEKGCLLCMKLSQSHLQAKSIPPRVAAEASGAQSLRALGWRPSQWSQKSSFNASVPET